MNKWVGFATDDRQQAGGPFVCVMLLLHSDRLLSARERSHNMLPIAVQIMNYPY